MKVSALEATSMITKFIQAKLVPLLVGSPGIGKSAIYQQIADKYNLLLIDIRLSQCDPSDLSGFPQIMGNKAGYVPMDTFPLEGDPIPKGYAGWLLLFDEITSALPALQASAYKILLDRKIGQAKLHKNVAVCAAGNKETDNAIVEPMSTALQSRMVHLELEVDHKGWIDWASSNAIDYRITSYIAFKPGNLYTFKPDHSDDTYASPRTWEFANRVMSVTEDGTHERLTMLAGTISEGVAREFVGFCKIHTELPTIVSITAAPESITMPVEPSILYALTGSIAHNVTVANFSQLVKFVCRMPLEFQVCVMRDITRRQPAMLGTPEMQKWVSLNKHELF